MNTYQRTGRLCSYYPQWKRKKKKREKTTTNYIFIKLNNCYVHAFYKMHIYKGSCRKRHPIYLSYRENEPSFLSTFTSSTCWPEARVGGGVFGPSSWWSLSSPAALDRWQRCLVLWSTESTRTTKYETKLLILIFLLLGWNWSPAIHFHFGESWWLVLPSWHSVVERLWGKIGCIWEFKVQNYGTT